MSSPILPAKGPSSPSTSTPAGNGSLATVVAELTLGEGAFAIEASRGAPPRQVLEQIARAARIEESLRESGRRVSFTSCDPSARTRIEIHDREGNVERTLSTTQAFQLAAGGQLA